jgi:tetratricopeptide (TPR) repeat protein
VELATGDFEAAERDVCRALQVGGETAGPWRSYNTALRGKILLDAGRFDDAAEILRRAWTDVLAGWQVRLGTTVRQYLVEYLLREGSCDSELEEAANLLEAQIADSDESGFKNMLVAGQSLTAELELRRGRADEACERNREAVEALEKSGDLPIVRTEEVLWRHARCLDAAGREGGDTYREKSRAVIERKAASLTSEHDRRRLLTATPVARALGLG